MEVKMNKKGFTLIELLITVAIIGILAAIGIPAYIGQQKNAARTEAYTNLQNLSLLEAQQFADQGSYTADLGTALKDHNGNVAVISATLPGFKPGTGLSFSYWIINGRQITNANIINGTNTGTAAVAAPAQCFIAFAQGNTVGRVPNETFAIDCNNVKNF
jgi:prepilin-type N-terminal cleavage/methylation domain-containing protein